MCTKCTSYIVSNMIYLQVNLCQWTPQVIHIVYPLVPRLRYTYTKCIQIWTRTKACLCKSELGYLKTGTASETPLPGKGRRVLCHTLLRPTLARRRTSAHSQRTLVWHHNLLTNGRWTTWLQVTKMKWDGPRCQDHVRWTYPTLPNNPNI